MHFKTIVCCLVSMLAAMTRAAETFLPVNPAATYLRTNQDVALQPIVIDLALMGIDPGDAIGLRQVGSFQWNSSLGSGGGVMLGCFSATSTVRDSAFLVRIPDAIDYGANFVTAATFHGGLSTDIAEDFLISSAGMDVVVPEGARYLFLTGHDVYYGDNIDPDGDYGVMLDGPTVIATNTTIASADDSYDNLRLKIRNCTVIMNGSHMFKSLVLQSNARVTCAGNATTKLNITTGSMRIDLSSALDLDGRGYGKNSGPGKGTTDPAGFGSGGSYGGSGGVSNSRYLGGATYGSYRQPADFGSGGGGGSASAGGGVLKLVVSGSLAVDGSIQCNGGVAGGNSGAGSGGSIWVQASSLVGTGRIWARGGYGPVNGYAGQGGGGRVALYLGANNFEGDISAATNYNQGNYPGGAGSVYIKLDSSALGDLIFDNNGYTYNNPAATDLSSMDVPDNLIIRGNARVTHPAGLGLTLKIAGSCFIDFDSGFDLSGRGYGKNSGPGKGTTDPAGYGSGGSYGGSGGVSNSRYLGGATYGSYRQPVHFGSGGGGGSASAGGGALKLLVSGSLAVDGSIQCNGGVAGGSSGAGSGGSIWVQASSLVGTGHIWAFGGHGPVNGYAGQGGGGRVALYLGANNFEGDISAATNYNQGNYPGGAGSVYIKLDSSALGDLIFDNNGYTYNNPAATDLSSMDVPDNLIIRGNAKVTHPAGLGLTLKIAGSCFIDFDSGLEISGRGYGKNTGPGKGLIDVNQRGSGAGYGGRGGRTSGFSDNGGLTYGSELYPSDLGSGGGGANGGSGGGLLRVTVGKALSLYGFMVSDGTVGSGSGGGSGGSISLSCNTFEGTGIVRANGGSTTDGAMGSGGGGRIAVYSRFDTFTGAILVDPGTIGFPGNTGTIVRNVTHTVAGSLSLNDFIVGSDSRPNSVLVEFLEEASPVVLSSALVPLGEDGSFIATSPGSTKYRIRIKASHWLAKVLPVNLTSTDVSGISMSLINGDIDGDNAITVFDYSVLSDYFDKTSADTDWNTVGANGARPSDADLDGDGAITVFDYSILSDHFDMVGDE